MFFLFKLGKMKSFYDRVYQYHYGNHLLTSNSFYYFYKKLNPIIKHRNITFLMSLIATVNFGQQNMIIPDLKNVEHKVNIGSTLQKTPLEGVRTAYAIIEDWNPQLQHFGSHHHTTIVSKEIFLHEKEKMNNILKQHKQATEIDQRKLQDTIPPPHQGYHFRGNQRGTSVPMDNTIAVSENGFIVSAINSNIIFTQPNGVITFSKGLSDFFALLGLGNRMYDPRAIYDTEENRFIVMCLNGSDPASTNLCVAFSKTEDPHGDWYYYKIKGNPSGEQNWFDYPNIAVSDHDLYIAGLMRNTAGDWQYSVLYQIDKNDGYQGKALTWKYYNELLDADSSASFNLVPAPAGWKSLLSPGMYFVSNKPLGGNLYNLYYTTAAVNDNPVFISLQAEGAKTILAPDGRQKSSNNLLNTFDSRIWSAIYLDSVIHIGSHVQSPFGNTGIFYGRFDISGLKVTADVLASDTVDYAFPSFAAIGSTENDPQILVNYLFSGPGIFPGQQQRICVGRQNSFLWSPSVTLKEGISAVDALSESRERWGDYTTASRRFLDRRAEVWVTGCFGETGSYGTWLGQYFKPDDSDTLSKIDFVASLTTMPRNVKSTFTNITPGNSEVLEWRFEGGNPEVSTIPSPEVSWSENGAYHVSMIVKSSEGIDTLVKKQYIHIQDPEVTPLADFIFDKDTIFRGDTVLFTSMSSQNTVLLKWNFTQGIPGTSNEPRQLVRYPLKGTFPVSLTVENTAGANTKTISKAITVRDRFKPTAIFSASSRQISLGSEVIFTDLSTGGPTSWLWYFEGGTPEYSEQKQPVVAYNLDGTYDVKLIVKNNAGIDSIAKEGFIQVGNSAVNDADMKFTNLKLYPNPVNQGNQIITDFNLKENEFIKFDIIDQEGRLIKELWHDQVKEGPNRFSFSTAHLSPGLYYLRISNFKSGILQMLTFMVY